MITKLNAYLHYGTLFWVSLSHLESSHNILSEVLVICTMDKLSQEFKQVDTTCYTYWSSGTHHADIIVDVCQLRIIVESQSARWELVMAGWIAWTLIIRWCIWYSMNDVLSLNKYEYIVWPCGYMTLKSCTEFITFCKDHNGWHYSCCQICQPSFYRLNAILLWRGIINHRLNPVLGWCLLLISNCKAQSQICCSLQ